MTQMAAHFIVAAKTVTAILRQAVIALHAKAPCVLLDAQRTLYLFEATHRAFRKSIPIFGPML
jgi:hypothetical protein